MNIQMTKQEIKKEELNSDSYELIESLLQTLVENYDPTKNFQHQADDCINEILRFVDEKKAKEIAISRDELLELNEEEREALENLFKRIGLGAHTISVLIGLIAKYKSPTADKEEE